MPEIIYYLIRRKRKVRIPSQEVDRSRMGVQAKKKNPKRIKKENYWQRLWGYCDKYQTALLVDVDNVSSKQIIKLRQKLRAIDAHFVCGKNTLMKAAINYKMG